ncbi:MAG: serine/threonine-protein kinase [bacterium]
MPIEIKEGDLIGKRYLIEKKINDGGMSYVYRGLDTHTHQTVALKVLQETLTSHHLEDKIRYYKEAVLVSRLSHPHIIKIYEVGEHQNLHYLVMEFITGEPLSKYLEKGLPLDVALDILIQVTEALDYVHQNGIIHRDIKPGNILIEREQEGNISKNNKGQVEEGTLKESLKIKIIDFGLAQLMYLSMIEEAEEIIGTFSYMSPEQSGIVRKPIDERSDLYSLGIIMYQLFSGELPFKGDTVSILLHQHIARKPLPLHQIKKEIPPILEEITLKLLEKAQETRYQTAKGLLADLKRYKQGETSFPLGKSDRGGKPCYRTALMSRSDEFRTLKILYNFAHHGRGGLCLISGEAGQGKSRFVEEFRAFVYEQGGEFISGKCFDQENKFPYQAIQEAINEYVSKIGQLTKEEQNRIGLQVLV